MKSRLDCNVLNIIYLFQSEILYPKLYKGQLVLVLTNIYSIKTLIKNDSLDNKKRSPPLNENLKTK